MRLATALALAVVLLVPAARAQTPGACMSGEDRGDLDVSDVRAALFNTGSLFYSNSAYAQYVVPRFSGKSPIFAAGVWIGGLVGGEVRTAGATYQSFEFWPGPLDDGAALPEPDCRRLNANGREAWDRVYVVSALDVALYDETGETTADLVDWPVGLGAPAVDANGDPVVPTSRDQLIDLAAGERPVIYGSQTAFWVMNDVGGEHASTDSPPLGLEVQVSAFSIADLEAPALDRGTFYRYRVSNRNDQPIEDTIFTMFLDPDLGAANDDYVGMDTTRSMAFTYNGNDKDAVYGTPPAVGYDFLGTGAAAHMHLPEEDIPSDRFEFYNIMQGLWTDGTPMTENGDGFGDGGPVTTYAYPGDPVTGQHWSELNPFPGAPANESGDRRNVVSSPAFTLEPGEEQVFDFAILFGWGSDHLDSITELREASDLVQALYDTGELFETRSLPDPILLDTPVLVAPPDGAVFVDEPAVLQWEPVPGAEEYHVEWSYSSNPADTLSALVTGLEYELDGPPNEVVEVRWRVRAFSRTGVSPYSETRHFTLYNYEAAWVGDGGGIVETAYGDGGGTCPDPGNPDDYGCTNGLPGNTVWHDGNLDDDYYVSAGGPGGGLDRLSRYLAAAGPDDYEVRFTKPGGYGVYAFTDWQIVRVPFELWNVGDEDDPEDDVRMIPFINPNPNTAQVPSWADAFTGTDTWTGSPCAGGCPITDWVYWMMPDRPNGYDLFQAAVLRFGGAGAIYDTTGTADGDTQVDLNPRTGTPCANQSVYVDWCYRLDEFGADNPDIFLENVYPIGRLVFADLAGDGTTPPEGTTVRFITNDPLLIAAEPDGPGGEQPGAFALLPAYPNPLRGRAVVPYVVPQAGRVRLAVYDVLGREVAVLAEGPHAAGRHEAVLEGAGLASGVYVVVLAGERARRALKLTVLR
jgi:hypothetical protein